MSATIRIHPMAGDDVKATSEQAVSVAEKLGITVEFDFNDVTCMARPGDCPDSLAADYHRVTHNGLEFKFARGHRKRQKPGRQERWFTVPDYRPDATPATSATVVDRAGQQVAHFERIADAETAVEAVNGREA